MVIKGIKEGKTRIRSIAPSRQKNKNSGRLKWSDVRKALIYLTGLSWKLVCLVRYLNPVHYAWSRMKAPSFSHVNLQGIYYPTFKERMRNYFKSEKTKRIEILEWAADQLPTLRISNLNTAWSDGVALCALLEAVCPGACPRWDLLKPQHKVNNCRLGLRLCTKRLEIPMTILTPEEMAFSPSASDTEAKMLFLLTVIKWVSAKKAEQNAQETTNQVYDGLPLRSPEPCTARGTGLVTGVVGKRCKFNIFVVSKDDLELTIDVLGPKEGERSYEKLQYYTRGNKPPPTPFPLATPTPTPAPPPQHRDSEARAGKLLWSLGKKSAKLLRSRGESTSSSQGSQDTGAIQEEGKPEDVDKKLNSTEAISNGDAPAARDEVKVQRIPFDYRWLNDGHILASYVPRSAGNHTVVIHWRNTEIKGSPFTCKVAESAELLRGPKRVSFEGVARGLTALRGLKSFKSSMSSISSTGSMDSVDDEEAETTTKTAVLSRSSTVHRSLAVNSGAKLLRRLSKQATVTRRRVLRRVVTKAGQEIVIHEAPTPELSDSELSSTQEAPRIPPPQRPGSPNPKPADKRGNKKGFDFQMTSTESSGSRGSRGNTPQGSEDHSSSSIDNVVSNMVDGIMTGVFRAISPSKDTEEFKFTFQEPLAEAEQRTSDTRTPPPTKDHKTLYSTKSTPVGVLLSKKQNMEETDSDDVLSSTSTSTTSSNKDRTLLLPPASENKFKCSPFSDYSEVPSGPRPKRGSMPDVTHRKLSSTKSSPVRHLKPMRRMSDNFLAIPDELILSGSPFVKAEFHQNQRTVSDVILPSVTVQDIDAMNVADDVITIHEHTIESGQIPLTDFHGSVVPKDSGVFDAEGSPEGDIQTKKKPNVTVHTQLKQKTKPVKLDCMKPSTKEFLKKTLSDPASRVKRDTVMSDRYSSTTPCSPNVSPKTQRSLEEQSSTGLYEDQDQEDGPSLKFIQSESLRKACLYISQKAVMESMASVKSEEKKPDVQIIGDKGHSVKVTFGGHAPKLASEPLKHHLRLSSSLPTLHRTWNAFEIDPDDTLTLEEMEALSVAAQQRPKRNTLDGINIPKELQDRASPPPVSESGDNRLMRITSDNFLDIKRAARTFHPSNDNTPLHMTPLSSPLASPGGSARSSRRSSLARMDFAALQRLSEEDSLDKADQADGDENDKENKPPANSSKNITDKHSNQKRTNQVQTLTVNQYSPRQSLSIRVPKAKIDRCTQVSYNEIKAETGWTKPEAFVRRRRIIVKDTAIDISTTSGSSAEKSFSLEQPPSGKVYSLSSGKAIDVEKNMENNNLRLQQQGATMTSKLNNSTNNNMTSQTLRQNHDGNAVSSPESKKEEKVKSSVTVYIYPEARRNSAPATPQIEQSPNYLAQPHRQSTVETIDSGIADDHNGGRSPEIVVSNAPRLSLDSRMLPIRPQPRFINGHRMVTRHSYRHPVSVDAHLIRDSSATTSFDDEKEGQGHFARHKSKKRKNNSSSGSSRGSEGQRSRRRMPPREDSLSISDAENIKVPKKYHGRSRLGSHKRKVTFSKKVMMYRRSSSRTSSRNSSKMSKESTPSPGNSLQSIQSSKDLSQDQADSSLPVVSVAVPTVPATSTGDTKTSVQASGYLDARIGVLKRKTLTASTSEEKRTAIHEWMSQNYMGPSDKSTSGEDVLPDNLDLHGLEMQKGHTKESGDHGFYHQVTDKSHGKQLYDFEPYKKGPGKQLYDLEPYRKKGQSKQLYDLEPYNKGIGKTKTPDRSPDIEVTSSKDIDRYKMNTHLGVVSSRQQSPQPHVHQVIVCECSKYSLHNREMLVTMGIHPSELCKDLSVNSSKDTQFLSVDGIDGGFSGMQPYSPQSSTDENYVGFGLSKGSRKDLLEEIVNFSNLHPTGPELEPDQLLKHKTDSGFVSTTTTTTTTTGPSPPCASDRHQHHHHHDTNHHQYQFTDIYNEILEPPPARRYSKPPELTIEPFPPGSESTCSPEVAKLTTGLEWPSSPLALLSPLLPGPTIPQEWETSDRIAEHFQEDYFSFTGLVDVKHPQHHQSLLERFLDEAAGMAADVDAEDGNFIEKHYSDDDDDDENRIFRFSKVPDAGRCSAFGPGLELGQVLAKNNFQVDTRGAGNGSLSVGISGPRSHTVQDVSVVYTGDDFYEVEYEVSHPGYYVITLRWSDFNIPNSPFICKVTH